jgi:hypothetical protein
VLTRIATGLVAAAAVVAAVGGPLPTAPAAAEDCAAGRGVTVVVDFNELGGGTHTACVAQGGGETASRLFTDAGFDLTHTQRDPSFVCRVAGEPGDDPCVNTPPANAYWSLWWSDGSSTWVYATLAADSLTVPQGGYVGFSWQQGSATRAPDVPIGGGSGETEEATSATRPGSTADGAADDDGLPGWVAPAAVVVLFGAAGTVVVVRRRQGAA